jgi:hypothetical protein
MGCVPYETNFVSLNLWGDTGSQRKAVLFEIPNTKLITHLSNAMQYSPSWEANCSSVSKEIPHIPWNPKVQYRVHKSSSLEPDNFVPRTPEFHPLSRNYILILFKNNIGNVKILASSLLLEYGERYWRRNLGRKTVKLGNGWKWLRILANGRRTYERYWNFRLF